VQVHDHIVTISDSLKFMVQKTMPDYPEAALSTIGNPATSVRPAAGEEIAAFLEAHGLSSKRYFLFAGRKTYGKGVDLAVDAIGRMDWPSAGFKMLLLGRGRIAVDCPERVVDHPPVSQSLLLGLLENAMALVIPGRWQEGLHRTMIDALRMGIPIICTEAGAPPVEGVLHQVNGVICPCNDASALAESMNELLRWDGERLRQCRYASRRCYDLKFSDEVILRRWKGLVEKLLLPRGEGKKPHSAH
jgi:glycosyltransferase involved in cell wall biosynthesis